MGLKSDPNKTVLGLFGNETKTERSAAKTEKIWLQRWTTKARDAQTCWPGPCQIKFQKMQRKNAPGTAGKIS
ncbi:hypothetical protein KY328_03715 [Candidatus Woesearchaeota archaeon]|nr:hypothetical protein [Candidatus Woesearchaeota archaeon]